MIISIDPGVTTGVAIYSGRKPALSTIKRPTPADADLILDWCQRKAVARAEPLVMLIEDQFVKIHYVRKGSSRKDLKPTIDVPALLTLTRSAELWVVVATIKGIQWRRIKPSVWQGEMLSSAPKTRNGEPLSTKSKATHVVHHMWDTVATFEGVPEDLTYVETNILNEHQRDAALMGLWYELHKDDQ